MTDERKEGMILVVAALTAIFLLAMLTDWHYGFWDAGFGFGGFERHTATNCRTEDLFRDGNAVEVCDDNKEQIMSFSVRFSTVLAFLGLIAIYGGLRAMGFVRRIFAVERHISKLFPTSSAPDGT